jgi:dTDP-glucose 4,6-dehydratase
MSKKTFLITGGAGFIGSHLCEHFLAKGFKVVAVDNLITGNLNNIAHLRAHANFEFVHHDISRHIEYPEPVHFILHFASPASPIDYLNFPIQTLKVGSLGTHNALGLAKAKKARFLLASTSEVYGDPLVHPQKEDYWGNVNPIGPRGVYDEAKRFAEAISMAYHRVHKVDVKIIRIFNTYGPRMRLNDGRAIPAFVSQALLDKPIPVFGKGTQTRSFCYVNDLVAGIEKMIFSNLNEPVNLGNPNEMTILQLANTIIRMMKSKSTIKYEPLPMDDPKVRQPDITKARKLLGWQPAIALEEGLTKTISYFRDHKDLVLGTQKKKKKS